jgi:hypothetical protein
VLDASRAVEAAVAQGDVQAIRMAASALEQALRGEFVPVAELALAAVPAATEVPATLVGTDEVAPGAEPSTESLAESPTAEAATPTAAESVAAQSHATAQVSAAPRKVVAVRGDDRPGMKRAEPAGRDDRRGPPRDRDARGPARSGDHGSERGQRVRGDGESTRPRSLGASPPRRKRALGLSSPGT